MVLETRNVFQVPKLPSYYILYTKKKLVPEHYDEIIHRVSIPESFF